MHKNIHLQNNPDFDNNNNNNNPYNEKIIQQQIGALRRAFNTLADVITEEID